MKDQTDTVISFELRQFSAGKVGGENEPIRQMGADTMTMPSDNLDEWWNSIGKEMLTVLLGGWKANG